MKLAKKLTSRTLQRKGLFGSDHLTRPTPFGFTSRTAEPPAELDLKTASVLNPFQRPSEPQQVSPSRRGSDGFCSEHQIQSEHAGSVPGPEGFSAGPASVSPAETGLGLRGEPAGPQEQPGLPVPDPVP